MKAKMKPYFQSPLLNHSQKSEKILKIGYSTTPWPNEDNRKKAKECEAAKITILNKIAFRNTFALLTIYY